MNSLSGLFSNKNYILIIGAFILFILSYELAFKKTFQLLQLHSQLSKQLEKSTNVSIEPVYIIRKNANLDKIIKIYKQDSTTFRNNVVNDIASIAAMQNVKLTTVPTDDQIFHNPQYIIQKLVFEGDFFSAIKLLDKLQNTQGIGVLRSLTLKRPRISNQSLGTDKLNLEIFMEMYR